MLTNLRLVDLRLTTVQQATTGQNLPLCVELVLPLQLLMLFGRTPTYWELFLLNIFCNTEILAVFKIHFWHDYTNWVVSIDVIYFVFSFTCMCLFFAHPDLIIQLAVQ
jgi:hypothetical protein